MASRRLASPGYFLTSELLVKLPLFGSNLSASFELLTSSFSGQMRGRRVASQLVNVSSSAHQDVAGRINISTRRF
jgi:hypothetical protein